MPDMRSTMPNIVDFDRQPPQPSSPVPTSSLRSPPVVCKSFLISYTQNLIIFRPYEVRTERPRHAAPPLIEGCGLTIAGLDEAEGLKKPWGGPSRGRPTRYVASQFYLRPIDVQCAIPDAMSPPPCRTLLHSR
jgi:hypothetical protein